MARDKELEVRKLPKQLRAKQTVDAIFEAAMQVLDRESTEPSVQKIADRAGCVRLVALGAAEPERLDKPLFVDELTQLVWQRVIFSDEQQFRPGRVADQPASARRCRRGTHAHRH